MRILVVDDSEINRSLCSMILKEGGHEILHAENGRIAVEKSRLENPDLILMDVMMPEMDGYESANIIRSDAREEYLPIIFLTALSDTDVLAKCLANGGDDFISKPIESEILEAKVRVHERIRLLQFQVLARNELLKQHQIQLERDHDIVKHVLDNALDGNCKAESNLQIYTSPMSRFNGDIALVSRSPAGGLYIMLGDFTGHGLSAAIGSLPVCEIFYTMTRQGFAVGDIAAKINKVLLKLLPAYMFLAASIALLDENGESISIWSGGMNDLILTDSKGSFLRYIHSRNLALGIMKTSEFKCVEESIAVPGKERLYLYSDGIVESSNAQGDMYGEERLRQLFDGASESTFHSIINSVTSFSSQSQQNDDISLIELICVKPRFHIQEQVIDKEKAL